MEVGSVDRSLRVCEKIDTPLEQAGRTACPTRQLEQFCHRGAGGFACRPITSRPLAVAARADAASDPAKVREAASQFEALLLAQMLRSVHEAAGDGWLGAGGDEAGGMMLEVAQEHLAQVLASQGGLGLANLVTDGLSRTGEHTSTSKLPGPGFDKMS